MRKPTRNTSPPARQSSSPHRRRRTPLLLILGIILLALLGVFVGINVWSWRSYQLAQQALAEEKLDEAQASIQQCLNVSLWPSVATHLLAARIERMLGNYQAAGKHMEKSLSLQGQRTEAIQLEGMLLASETGNMDEPTEQKLWQLVNDEHADSAQILRTLAKVDHHQWRFLAALDCLNQWLVLNPDSGEALEIRASVWGWLEKSDRVEEDLRQSLAVAPHRNSARLALVNFLLGRTSDPEEILEHVQVLLQSNPDHVGYQVALARCKALQGDFAAARDILDQVLETSSGYPPALLQQAKLSNQAGEFAAAEKWAQKIIDVDPNNLEAYQLLADSMKRQNDPKKSKKAKAYEKKVEAGKADHKRLGELLKESYEKERENPNILAEMGSILLRQGQDKAGLMCLEQALKKDPGHQAAHLALAMYYEKQGAKEKAAKHWQKVSGGAPK